MIGNRRHDVWAKRVLAAPSIATSSERRGVHRLKDVAKRLLNKGSTECRTQLPMFLVLFSKKYREKDLKKNTSEQLRLRTAVEFDGERKRVFLSPNFCRWTHICRCAVNWVYRRDTLPCPQPWTMPSRQSKATRKLWNRGKEISPMRLNEILREHKYGHDMPCPFYVVFQIIGSYFCLFDIKNQTIGIFVSF